LTLYINEPKYPCIEYDTEYTQKLIGKYLSILDWEGEGARKAKVNTFNLS
jgi:hypothetical protein